MLQNAYFLAKIGADTAENEQHFAENFAKNWQLLRTKEDHPRERAAPCVHGVYKGAYKYPERNLKTGGWVVRI